MLMTMKTNLTSLGINPGGRTAGELRAACPFCKDKHERHAKSKCLAVNLDNGTYYCHRCGAKGRLDGLPQRPARTYFSWIIPADTRRGLFMGKVNTVTQADKALLAYSRSSR